MKLKEIQDDLVEQNINGWLLYDFRKSNPFVYTVLEIPEGTMLTRRFFYWIPQSGEPVKIVPCIEPYTLDHLPGIKWAYRSWQELEKLIFSISVENSQIAMEYSPYNALPAISKVDAGIIELIRKGGAQVVSSAHLLQKYTAVWTEAQFYSHLIAADVLCQTVDKAWAFIAQTLSQGKTLNEYQVQQFMLNEMHKQGCITDHAPICAINEHSADPHYAPDENESFCICKGDFILLDLWCKKNQPRAVYADIARVGIAASKPTPFQQNIFEVVKQAREQATQLMQNHYEKGLPLQGWQVDQVCRDIIQASGYGEYFIHRTGHHIGQEVHGPGVNLDNFETHDFRFLMPGICVSVEPGIYLPNQFGIRLEYDVYFNPNGTLSITGGIQKEIICLT